MKISFVQIAEANIESLVKSINKVIVNPIILLLFAVALVMFLFGVLKYLLNPDNEEIRKASRSHMLWGIIGMFIMVSVFGIMNLILNTLGEKDIKINGDGTYRIEKTIN